MSGAELRGHLLNVGWKKSMLADRVGVYDSTVHSWLSDSSRVPAFVADYVRADVCGGDRGWTAGVS